MTILKFLGENIRENRKKITQIVLIDNSVMNETVLINMKRVFIFSILAMIVNLASIFIISMDISSGDEIQTKWRNGIMNCHGVLFIMMLILGFMSFCLRKREEINLTMKFIQYITILIVLIFGSILVSIDQYITTSITPFLIACTIIGAVFLIRPFAAIIIYMITFIIYFNMMSLFQMDQVILLSNRINGITAIGIGLCLSTILWKTNVSNILQKRYIVNQQQELAEKNRELEYLAFHDTMTCLYNRGRFEELLQNELLMIRRYGHESCIIIVDIDQFKIVNDNYGHPVGDMVIKQVACLLKGNIRETDSVSRWGGEEYLILLPHTSLFDGKLVAEKLRKIIENEILYIKEEEIHITASFGIARLRCDIKDSLELAYKDADEALYMAKKSGKNRVEIA